MSAAVSIVMTYVEASPDCELAQQSGNVPGEPPVGVPKVKTAEAGWIFPGGGFVTPVHVAAVAVPAPHEPSVNNTTLFESTKVLPSDVKNTEHSSPRVHRWSVELAPLSAPVDSTVTRAFATTPFGLAPQQTT
jgi:hypothetical protein